MFGRVRGKWIIQAAVQLCQFRISFNGGKTSWGNFFQLLAFALLCDFPRRASWGGVTWIEEEFHQLWVSIWAAGDVVDGWMGIFHWIPFKILWSFKKWSRKLRTFNWKCQEFDGICWSFPTDTLQILLIFRKTTATNPLHACTFV